MRTISRCSILAAAFGLAFPANAADELEQLTVKARRLPELAAPATISHVRFDADELAAAPAIRLDAILRSVPGAGLFRRTTSRTANPTIQGITLRGLGPNGAGRALVTLDGIPQNDPFGGWMYWSAIAPGALHDVTLVRGANPASWGNQALAGAIAIRTARGEPGFEGGVSAGNRDSFEGWGRASFGADALGLTIEGQGFDTDGSFVVGADQRGPVDVRAASDAWHAAATADGEVAPDIRLIIRAKYFEENRINGLELSTNGTESTDLSASLIREGGGDSPDWQVNLFHKDRDFRNSFASVTADRASTRMVLDQFDVPATGWGANGIVRAPVGDGGEVEAGFDLRINKGETNERFRNLGAGFTRVRAAGGEQDLAGAHLGYTHEADRWTWQASGRLDYWRNHSGSLTENDLATGASIRDDQIEDGSGWVANGRIAADYRATNAVHLRGSLYSGFRVPTLNELYRPFRVGNDITEANPDLVPERVYGFDLGLVYQPITTARFEATIFRNWLKNGVGNVTLELGPGFFPPTGFVPAGGSLRQRRNVDRIVADGIELTGILAPNEVWSLSISYLFTDPKVKRFVESPGLIGNRLIQTARHQVTASGRVNPTDRVWLALDVRGQGAAFDDDQNTRRLSGYALVDAAAGYRISDQIEIMVRGENLTDSRIEAGLNGAGLFSLGEPTSILAGVRVRL